MSKLINHLYADENSVLQKMLSAKPGSYFHFKNEQKNKSLLLMCIDQFLNAHKVSYSIFHVDGRGQFVVSSSRIDMKIDFSASLSFMMLSIGFEENTQFQSLINRAISKIKKNMLIIVDLELHKIDEGSVVTIQSIAKDRNCNIIYVDFSKIPVAKPNNYYKEVTFDDIISEDLKWPRLTTNEKNNRNLIIADLLVFSGLDLTIIMKNEFSFDQFKEIAKYLSENTRTRDYQLEDILYLFDDGLFEEQISLVDQYALLQFYMKYDPYNNKILRLLSQNFSTYLSPHIDFIDSISLISASTNKFIQSLEKHGLRNNLLNTYYSCIKNLDISSRVYDIKYLFEQFSLLSCDMDIPYILEIGVYLFSELFNRQLIDQSKEVSSKLCKIFDLPFGDFSKKYIQIYQQKYTLKNTFTFNIGQYKRFLNDFLDGNSFVVESLKEMKIYAISNFVGICLYNESIDCFEEIKLLINLIKNCPNKYDRVWNNLLVSMLKRKQLSIDVLISITKYFSNELHVIITNNLIGLIFELDSKNTYGKLIEKLYSKLFGDLAVKNEAWFYNFFYMINRKIVLEKYPDIFIERLPMVHLPKLYSGTYIEDFLKDVESLYYFNERIRFEDFLACYYTKNDYRYPYKYLFIDFQYWGKL